MHSKAAIHFISGFGIGGVGVDGQVPSNSGECFFTGDSPASICLHYKRKAQIQHLKFTGGSKSCNYSFCKCDVSSASVGLS